MSYKGRGKRFEDRNEGNNDKLEEEAKIYQNASSLLGQLIGAQKQVHIRFLLFPLPESL